MPSNYGPEFDRFERCHIVLAGQRALTVSGIPLARPDWACTLSNIWVSARSSAGTTPSLTVDLKVGSTSKLTAPVTVTALVWTAGAPATDPSLAAGAVLTATLTIGGTLPMWDDIAMRFDLLRTW
jgi:hypothetical protein